MSMDKSKLPRAVVRPKGTETEVRPDAAQLASVIHAGLLAGLEACQAAFARSPSAHNWVEVTEYMYAWQYWHGLTGERRARTASALATVGVALHASWLRSQQSAESGIA